MGTNVRTSWQQELWGTVGASEVGSRATTGVYVDMGGSVGQPLRESAESRYDLWTLLESFRRKYDSIVEIIWRGMIRDQS